MVELLGMFITAFGIGLFGLVILSVLAEVRNDDKVEKPIKVAYVIGGLFLAGFLFGSTLFLILYALGVFG